MTGKPLPRIVRTERLLLRPFEMSDVDAIMEYATDLEWSRYLPVPQPYRRTHAKEFVRSHRAADLSRSVGWAITYDGVVAGGIDVRLCPEHRLAEIGYSIAPRLWGRGLCTEAARAVVDLCFANDPELGRVRASTDARNLASQRVLEKLGFTREGVLRQNRVVHGEAVDEVWFGVLRSEG